MRIKKTIVPVENLAEVQYKLYDFYELGCEVDDLIPEIPKNHHKSVEINKKLFRNGNNVYELIESVCPECNSNKIGKNGFNPKIIVFKDIGKVNVHIQRYYCKECGYSFNTEVDGYIEKNSTYSTIIKDFILFLLRLEHITLRNIVQIVKKVFKVLISPQTVKNWLGKYFKNDKKEKNDGLSGYCGYDEQYVKICKKWLYRMVFFDVNSKTLIHEDIKISMASKDVENFLKESMKYVNVKSITTDMKPMYKEIIDNLGVKHQICIWHFKKDMRKAAKEVKKENELNDAEISLIYAYLDQIFQIVDSETYEEAMKNFQSFLLNLYRVPLPFMSVIENKFIKNIDRLLTHLLDENIPRTNNATENYFRNTLPKAIKKSFKTISGVKEFLTLQREKWDYNNKIHINH
jgi:transposase-like protein